MAAKSLGTPSVMESPEVSRHTTGSNHIWKTSSGKSDLKSHLTVSQRLGVRDKEGMEADEKAGLFTLRHGSSPDMPACASSASSRRDKIGVRPSVEKEGISEIIKH